MDELTLTGHELVISNMNYHPSWECVIILILERGKGEI